MRASTTLTAADIEEALNASRGLLDPKWIERQADREPTDLLLAHKKKILTSRELTKEIRDGNTAARQMHPSPKPSSWGMRFWSSTNGAEPLLLLAPYIYSARFVMLGEPFAR